MNKYTKSPAALQIIVKIQTVGLNL